MFKHELLRIRQAVSRYVAYTAADGAACLAALPSGEVLWKSAPKVETQLSIANWVRCGACMEFSQDQRYLAQQLQLRLPETSEVPNTWARNRGSQNVQVW